MADKDSGNQPSLALLSFGRGRKKSQSEPELFADAPPPKPRCEFRLTTLAAPVAAGVTGLSVGVFAVGLTWLSLRGCEAVNGTSSCGNPGLLLLLVVVGLLGMLGTVLLRPSASSTPAAPVRSPSRCSPWSRCCS